MNEIFARNTWTMVILETLGLLGLIALGAFIIGYIIMSIGRFLIHQFVDIFFGSK